MTSHSLSPGEEGGWMGGGGGWRIFFAWFSGGTKGRLVVADSIQKEGLQKTDCKRGGGGGH